MDDACHLQNHVEVAALSRKIGASAWDAMADQEHAPNAGDERLVAEGAPQAPDPAPAARLTTAQVTAALKRAGRRGDLAQRARDIRDTLRAPHLAQPAVIAEAYAASVTAQAAVITVLNEQIRSMEAKVRELFRRHPDAGTYLSQPGIGDITGARILGEFGDAPGRYATAKARKNYAGTSPLTIQSDMRVGGIG